MVQGLAFWLPRLQRGHSGAAAPDLSPDCYPVGPLLALGHPIANIKLCIKYTAGGGKKQAGVEELMPFQDFYVKEKQAH